MDLKDTRKTGTFMNLTIIYHCGLMENTKALYREFARRGIKISIIVPKKIKLDSIYTKGGFLVISKKDFEPAYNLIPVDLINIHKYNLGFYPLQLLRALKISKPDVIHILNEYSSFHVTQTIFSRNILYGTKVPIVTYAFQNIKFTPFSFNFNFSLKSLKKTFKEISHSFIFAYNRKYIDGVTAVSSKAIENTKVFNPNILKEHIFWGIDFNNFYPKSRNLYRKKLGIPEDIKLIGYFGRFIKEKGLDELVKAVSKIEKCHLMLVGKGNYEDELNKIIDTLGIRNRVYRYNSIKTAEIVDYYNCLDAFVLPSQTTPKWKEQYGKVLVEAMACNIPIIGSSSGAIPEVLRGYPKHLIFKEGSISDLMNKINEIGKLRFPKDFKINAFLNKFSVENFVSKHIEFYNNLLTTKICVL